MKNEKLVKLIEKNFLKDRVTPKIQDALQEELFYLECNMHDAEYMYRLFSTLKKQNKKVSNIRNSAIYYALGMSDDVPKDGGIDRTPTTMPDIDYDTDGRDEIKAYLVGKYGQEHTTLIGTYGSLKTKGAVKDIIRVLKEQETSSLYPIRDKVDFEFVNNLTKKFEVVKRLDPDAIKEALINAIPADKYAHIEDYNSEIAYFYACLESDGTLKKWFTDHVDVKEALEDILGNVKTTGIHAGGIIVSRAIIPNIAPLFYSKDEQMYITQPEMAYVEESGLIKYDFLGLKTLGDLNRVMRLVNARHNKNFSLSNIPMTDQDVFKLFTEGKTESIFQFNTDLAVSILTKLKDINTIIDLAIITSIARPGPLSMGMHTVFIESKNSGNIEYLHKTLEPILNETYGILCFQESVIEIAKNVGNLDKDAAVSLMKALSKKQADKVKKYVDQLKANAISIHGYKEEQAQELYERLYAFSQYGFNKSHAVAYACVSYLSMWFKHYYPAEWISAVLTGSDKDDFKILYPRWKDYIQTPDINLSKDVYIITDKNKVIMPLSHINGVGEKVTKTIIAKQPFASFDDFMDKVNPKNKVTGEEKATKASKEVILSLIFSGAFDSMKPNEHYSEGKWRKELAVKYYTYRSANSKVKKEKEEILGIVKEIVGMTRGKIMMKEISLLNFTSFDYYSYYYKQMSEDSEKHFGKAAIRPDQVKDYASGQMVVVGGGIESITFAVTKSGKDKGKEMVRIKLSNEGQSCEITIFAGTLERDDKGGGKIRTLKEQTPIIVKGKINVWNDRISVVYDESWILTS